MILHGITLPTDAAGAIARELAYAISGLERGYTMRARDTLRRLRVGVMVAERPVAVFERQLASVAAEVFWRVVMLRLFWLVFGRRPSRAHWVKAA